jgi:SAM-dependent methyltransferase
MSMISNQFKLIKRRLGRDLIGRNPFDLAYYFCKGSGLEVGARNNPYQFGNKCKVVYADIADETVIENILQKGFKIGPALSRHGYAKVDYVLKGPKYGFEEIKNNFFDFVYSDNVLEHTPNPIFSLIEQLRITKVGGFVYAVIPNKEYTFDCNRETTSIDKLVAKYQTDIFNYSLEEALDIIRNTKDFPKSYMQGKTSLEFAKLMIEANDGEYHFHVFDIENTLAMLNFVCQISDSSLHYFSGPKQKYIHFAICKSL